jgi:DNA-binding GntR family transcriptional regulator
MSVDKAYELIKESIVSLELDPGESVAEIILARRVGLAPGPVNEAVERLISEGWLERTDKGVKVTEDSLRNILDQLFEVRSVLEGLCARLAAEHATQDQVAYLESLMPQFEEVARKADNQAWIQLDQRFHEAIYDAAGNIFLESALKELYTLDLRIFYLVLNRITDLPHIVESHRSIVNALKAGDARAAERALTKHLQDSQESIMPHV